MYIILQNDTKVKIVGYDLELERYDGEDGNTYSPSDFKELIISKEEFQKIIKNWEQKLLSRFLAMDKSIILFVVYNQSNPSNLLNNYLKPIKLKF